MNTEKRPGEAWLAAALVIFIGLLAYGILIPWLGFYRDDWYMILGGQRGGVQELIALFESDRPFIGYLYALDFRLLGNSPLGWHLLALVVRVAGGLSFLWLVRLIWHDRKTETLLLAALYIVYPGFFQQPVAATYVNLNMAVTASVLSFALTAYALQCGNRYKMILSSIGAVGLIIFYLAIFESMVGLEIARLVFIFYLLARRHAPASVAAIIRTFLWGAPYLLALSGFLIWRLFIFQSTRHSTSLDVLLEGYSVSLWHTALVIGVETIKDFFEATFQAWTAPLYLFTVNGTYIDLAISLCLAGLAVGAVLYYLRRYPHSDQPASGFYMPVMWIGALTVFLALFPINLAGRNISYTLQWDRYTLHAALGCVLLLGGFIMGISHGKARIILIAALIASGVITQFHSAAYYRDFWKYERALWWQLSWRAPNLETNTLLYASLPGNFGFFEDYEIFAPANLIYTPDAQVRLAADLINAQTAPLLQRGEVKGRKTRGVYVHRNYKNALMMVFPSTDSCLHVLDGAKLELPGYENLNLLYIAPYSKIKRIDTSAPETIPPADIFGKSPQKDWCYYFQKISLARQRNDWTEAARMADEAADQGFQPRDRSEWFPVFEAYANTNQLDKVEMIAQKMGKNEDMLLLYCTQLESLMDIPASYNYEYIMSTLCQPNP